MIRTSAEFLAKACNGEIFGASGLFAEDVKIDSRACRPGDMFVAVVGEVNDGHRFLEGAYKGGARIFLVSEKDAMGELLKAHPDACCILAADTQEAFKDMALGYLESLGNIRRIGITGSTGKTSTKALTTAVLKAKYNTICSQKNLNTHLGICLTSFLADRDTEVIVYEMGMDTPDELYGYTSWVKPELAVITNVGVVHMERIGSREGIAIEKLKIASHLEPDQTLIYNCDSPFLSEKEIRRLAPWDFRLFAVGEGDEARLKLSGAKTDGFSGIEFDLELEGKKQHFSLPFLGLHNAHNGALAAAVGLMFGISLEEAAEAMPKAVLEEKRLDVHQKAGITLIDDSYNANPDSMASALRTLASIPAKRRVAIISDMRELGDAEEKSHIEIGKLASELGLDLLIALGNNRALYAAGTRMADKPIPVMCFAGLDEASEYILPRMKEGDALLVKGSLSTRIHELADTLKKSLEALD